MSPFLLSHDDMRRAFDLLADPVFVKDRKHRWLYHNEAFAKLMGRPSSELIGKSDDAYMPPETVKLFWANDDLVFNSGQPHENEEPVPFPDGTVHTVWTRKYPMRNEAGEVTGLIAILTDVTLLQDRITTRAEFEQRARESEVRLQAQQTMLDQLSAPAVLLWDGIVLMPLVGDLTAERTTLLQQNLLGAATRHRARHIIVDITGIGLIDTGTAGRLLGAVQAARLLGARCILVGMSPLLAQTLVAMGIEFRDIPTFAVLQDGMALAFREMGYRITR
ncbi:PAS domain-containing protein [Pyxidicoccus fallax]|uniref:PAS domain-containing protein n=1 Tax=Pyxidicoccus fallax TaxID=394095 RepID=A0A848LG04_9BACT|nr:PAS domain-containing protein [Pyxidicoccus fallax]NMO17392.1 PAS domain-containing protein [Pyxidicoccus fallax]NPC77909.1 PAS domain-containing protein [Pyxidicoccus fallax]